MRNTVALYVFALFCTSVSHADPLYIFSASGQVTAVSDSGSPFSVGDTWEISVHTGIKNSIPTLSESNDGTRNDVASYSDFSASSGGNLTGSSGASIPLTFISQVLVVDNHEDGFSLGAVVVGDAGTPGDGVIISIVSPAGSGLRLWGGDTEDGSADSIDSLEVEDTLNALSDFPFTEFRFTADFTPDDGVSNPVIITGSIENSSFLVPEPSSLALIAVGGLALVRRRSR